jgi:hypothetical protein
MLSTIEAPPKPKVVDDQALPDATSISIEVMASTLSFTVLSPPEDGVTVDPESSSTLLVSPGNYFLNFTVLDDTFENPAIILTTPFGALNVQPTGPSTATLVDSNDLPIESGNQLFGFTFCFSKFGPGDPTIVNTPDPA